MPEDVEAPRPELRVQALREGAPGVGGPARQAVEEDATRVTVPARAALVILAGVFACGIGLGGVIGYLGGWRDGARQLGAEPIDAATRCVNRFTELAAETVRCARIVGVKPPGNRRRELPDVGDALYGPGSPISPPAAISSAPRP